MTIALIIAADEPALFYKSVEAAALDLESTDVENGVYGAAFGPAGEIYDIQSVGNTVIITRAASNLVQPERLRKLLLFFLATMNIAASEKEELSDLLQKCEPYAE